MTDSSAIIAVHEAAHAAACYILGPYPIEKLEAWETSGKMVHLPSEDEAPRLRWGGDLHGRPGLH